MPGCTRHGGATISVMQNISTLDLLEQRLAELWEPKPLQGFAEELLQRSRAELPRCVVCSFTNEGLVRWNDWRNISSWDWLEGAAQRLAPKPLNYESVLQPSGEFVLLRSENARRGYTERVSSEVLPLHGTSRKLLCP